MVKTVTKMAAGQHLVSIGSPYTYFPFVQREVISSFHDRSAIGGKIDTSVFQTWFPRYDGYNTIDYADPFPGETSFPLYIGGRIWHQYAFFGVYAFAYSPVIPDDTTGTTTLTVKTEPGGFTYPPLIAYCGTSSYLLGLFSPGGVAEVRCCKMYAGATPSEIVSAWPLDFADEWRDAFGDETGTIFNSGKFNTLTSFWTDNTYTAIKRKFIQWTPGGDAAVDDIELSDPDDDALFQQLLAPPPGINPGALLKGFAIATHPTYGFLVSINSTVGGELVRKFFQIDPTFSQYREILFQGTTTEAENSFAAENGFVQMAYDNRGDLLGLNIATGVYQTLATPIPEVPEWTMTTGDALVRAWTFSLDGHDFYVIRLGLQETLVYDASTKQWHPWSSLANAVWAVNTGFPWQGGTGKAETNIIVGDDTTGNLYWLDPTQTYDEPQTGDVVMNFERIASTFLSVRGRTAVDCFNLYLSADFGGDAERYVKLETSDDNGETYVDHGSITVAEAIASGEYSWRSLGIITAPGRLFRVTDDGAAQRLDGMEMNDGDDE